MFCLVSIEKREGYNAFSKLKLNDVMKFNWASYLISRLTVWSNIKISNWLDIISTGSNNPSASVPKPPRTSILSLDQSPTLLLSESKKIIPWGDLTNLSGWKSFDIISCLRSNLPINVTFWENELPIINRKKKRNVNLFFRFYFLWLRDRVR